MGATHAYAVGDWVRLNHPNYAGPRLARIQEIRPGYPWPYTVLVEDNAQLHIGITDHSEIEPHTPTDEEVARWLLIELSQ